MWVWQVIYFQPGLDLRNVMTLINTFANLYFTKNDHRRQGQTWCLPPDIGQGQALAQQDKHLVKVLFDDVTLRSPPPHPWAGRKNYWAVNGSLKVRKA